MATWLKSKNFSGTNGAHFYIALYYDITQDINQNKSTIKYYLYVGSADGYSASGASSTCRIYGQPVGSISNIGVNEYKLVGTYTDVVTHNNDGTKTITYSASILTDWDIDDAVIDNTVFVLPTIPRVSSIIATDAQVEGSTTINIAKASANFKHTITYSFDGLTGTVVSNFEGTSYGWIIPTAFYNKLTTTKYNEGKKCTLSCETINGTVSLGTSTTDFNVTVNPDSSNTKPTVSATFTLDSVTKSLNGNSNSYIINGVTNATIKLTGTAKNGASISKLGASFGEDKKIEGTSNPYTGTINGVDGGLLDYYAIDSRGIKREYSESYNFVQYIALTINPIFYRTNPTNNTVALTFTGSYFNGKFGSASTTANTLTVKYRYKLSTASSYGSYANLSTTIGTDGTYSNGSSPITLGTSFDYTKEYDFEIVATDKVGSVTKIQRVTVGKPVFDWGKSDFQFNVPAKLSSGNQILDYSTVSGNRIKLGSSKYWDSTGVMYNSTALNTVLSNMQTSLNTFGYNVTDDGSAVKTGMKYNSKDVYLKRITVDINATQGTFSKALGITLSNVTIFKIEGLAYSNSENWFSIPMGDFSNNTNWSVRFQLAKSNNKIEVTTANPNFAKAYFNIYYINN